MSNAFSARNAVVRIGANVFEGFRWKVRARSARIDITNFEGNGYSDAIGSVRDAEFTVEGFLDGTTSPFSVPLQLDEGKNMTDALKLYMNTTASGFWLFPLWLCEEFEMDATVRDGMKLMFSGVNKGTFTKPVSA